MGSIGKVLAPAARLSLGYAERLLVGLRPGQFARHARPGGTEIRSNHAAFVYGHLALYPAKILAPLGQPIGDATTPPQYEALFKNGVECQDDPNGSRYPSMDEICTIFRRGYTAAIAAVEQAGDAALLAANPSGGRMGELFPTLGSMLNFYLTGHVQVHLGQVSAWRRALGLPPA
ncbi:MAG: DinB family protein [Planctomycetes bacterium]|nr:DinB family protein [Planctomycetota bacterium]